MPYLILSILSSTAIAVIFKIQDRIGIKLFPVIVINYIIAAIIGIILTETELNISEIIQAEWIVSGIMIGILLIAGFYLIGYSTQKVGIAITTVSNKMSVVIPILFSVLYFNEEKDFIKFAGIILALSSIALTVFRKKKKQTDVKFIWIPILLFMVIGIIDSLIKFAQTNLDDETIPVFTVVTFGIAFLAGIIGTFFNSVKIKDFQNHKVILTGIVLGGANYGSMYFLISALEKSNLDSSVVFGINNVGIITLSVLFAYFVFKEVLRPINWIGIGISIISILLLSNILF
jgi:drug/metabolite transporter (DMT)-like permease